MGTGNPAQRPGRPGESPRARGGTRQAGACGATGQWRESTQTRTRMVKPGYFLTVSRSLRYIKYTPTQRTRAQRRPALSLAGGRRPAHADADTGCRPGDPYVVSEFCDHGQPGTVLQASLGVKQRSAG